MKVLVASLVTFVVVLAGGGVAYSDSSPRSIGVTGVTSWHSEYKAALRGLKRLGIQIHDGCTGNDRCVVMSHYRANDNQSAYSWSGSSNSIHLNDHYDTGSRMRRLHIFYHEFAHVAGLDHSPNCDSSTYATVPACGHYIVGYTSSELAYLRSMWS